MRRFASVSVTSTLSLLVEPARTLLRSACGAAAIRFKRAGVVLAAAAAVLLAGAAADKTALAQERAVVIVAFGDSLTAGYGLPIEEGFAPQLEAWLHENGAPDAIVINAGVSGDTTSAGLSRLDWSIGPDADAVLLELGANDALRGVDPALARANLDAMLTRLDARGLPVLLAGMLAPRNWGPEYVEAFEAMYPELADKHGVPLYPFFLEGVAGNEGMFQEDRLHPNKDGVAAIVAAIGPSVLELVETVRAERAAQ